MEPKTAKIATNDNLFGAEYFFKSKKKRTAPIVPATIRPESFIQAKQPSAKIKIKIKKVPREDHIVYESESLSLSAWQSMQETNRVVQ